MNRAAVRSALGRSCSSTRQPGQRCLSTTQWRRDDQPTRPPPTNTRQRLAAAASELDSLRQSTSPRQTQGVDARSLGASRGPGSGTAMINLRSLKGRLTPRPPRFGANSGQPFTPRSGAPRTPFGRSAAGGQRGGVRGRGGRGGGRGGRGRRGGDREDGRQDDSGRGKLTWEPEEQAWINRMEQGVVTEYTPSVSLDTLAGHGPAIATDGPLGKVEAAMRSMRILGGGKPFSPEGYFNDPKDNVKRYYHEKKPVFFDSIQEKEWFESSQDGVRIYPPKQNTKDAIVQTAIQGKYTAPKFAAVGDTLGTLASYHTREATYTATDGEKFDAKVRSLLPAQQAAGKAAAAARPRKSAS